jgi:hypothetical protein
MRVRRLGPAFEQLGKHCEQQLSTRRSSVAEKTKQNSAAAAAAARRARACKHVEPFANATFKIVRFN